MDSNSIPSPFVTKLCRTKGRKTCKVNLQGRSNRSQRHCHLSGLTQHCTIGFFFFFHHHDSKLCIIDSSLVMPSHLTSVTIKNKPDDHTIIATNKNCFPTRPAQLLPIALDEHHYRTKAYFLTVI